MIPAIEPLGIRPRFPKLKSYLKAYEQGIPNWNQELANLNRYAKEGAGFEVSYEFDLGSYKYHLSNAATDLIRVSNALRWHAIQKALGGGQDWFGLWEQSVAYGYWHARIGLSHIEQILAKKCSDLQGAEKTEFVNWRNLIGMGRIVGQCIAVGWREWATAMTERVFRIINNERIVKNDESLHPRIHFTVLRLAADWLDIPGDRNRYATREVPILDALADHWQTPDPTQLASLLLAICDLHTHESGISSRKQSFELDRMALWYDPFEVQTVLRLRHWCGLENPALEHVIINTPLGQLRDSNSPYSDNLLDSVIARAQTERPNL